MDLRDRLQSALGDAYRLDRELGGGGMSRVFSAVETSLGRTVVIKTLPPGLTAGLSAERFRREIRLLAHLSHPNIVPILSAGDREGLLYYMMPFIAGETLRHRMQKDSPLPIDEAVAIATEIAEALDYAHRQGIVHRDIKPENILLVDNHAIISDFGIARAITRAVGEESLTGTGMIVGTPGYMSPEQAAGERDIDGRADIYALGCMLYEMLTGGPPFGGKSAAVIVAHHMTTPAPSVRLSRSTAPPALDAVIQRAMAKAPSDRYATAAEVVRALRLEPAPGPLGYLDHIRLRSARLMRWFMPRGNGSTHER
ncbi:MAG TPA: serine/threonine-protein kinase [Gemmatimonadaceae bacterium]|nr:serine/threonine-protein kinase [Gemmatimonadaceae bacterium]